MSPESTAASSPLGGEDEAVLSTPERMGLRFAAPARRLIAFAADFLLIGGYILAVAAAGTAANLLTGGIPMLASPLVMDALAFLAVVLPAALYFAWLEGSPRRATWGKRRVGIVVVDARGGRLSPWRSLLRAAVKFAPWQLAHTCVIRIWFGDPSPLYLAGAVVAQGLVLVYLLCLWLDGRHRTPYDRAAGSYVVALK